MKTKKFYISYVLTFPDGYQLRQTDKRREGRFLGGDLWALQEYAKYNISVANVTITPA